jgi:hypothetical protein
MFSFGSNFQFSATDPRDAPLGDRVDTRKFARLSSEPSPQKKLSRHEIRPEVFN